MTSNDPMIKDKILERILDKDVQSIAIVMHNRPDSDTIGSAVALEEALVMIGKLEVDLIIHNKVNRRFAPLLGRDRVERILIPSDNKRYDLLIMVDFSDPTKTVKGVEDIADFIIVLDHHVSNRRYGDLYWCENVSSTGVLVYRLIREIIEVTPTIANAIYATIVGDTNHFRNANTDWESHEIVADLLRRGANVRLINGMFDTRNLSFFYLMGMTFSNIKIDREHRIAYLVVTRDKIRVSGVREDEVSTLIDYLKWIKEADVVFLFIEGVKNVRISARSNRGVRVDKILRRFGGGGHPSAAGCAVEGMGIHSVVNEVVTYARRFLNESDR